MDLSVPGVRSPVCMGITVWQVAHRQIWWEPRWRTERQPRARNGHLAARAEAWALMAGAQRCTLAAPREGWLCNGPRTRC